MIKYLLIFCVYLTVSVFCDDTADKSVFFFVQPFVVVVVVVHSYLQLFVFCPLTRMKLEKQAWIMTLSSINGDDYAGRARLAIFLWGVRNILDFFFSARVMNSIVVCGFGQWKWYPWICICIDRWMKWVRQHCFAYHVNSQLFPNYTRSIVPSNSVAPIVTDMELQKLTNNDFIDKSAFIVKMSQFYVCA